MGDYESDWEGLEWVCPATITNGADPTTPTRYTLKGYKSTNSNYVAYNPALFT